MCLFVYIFTYVSIIYCFMVCHQTFYSGKLFFLDNHSLFNCYVQVFKFYIVYKPAKSKANITTVVRPTERNVMESQFNKDIYIF